MTVSCTNGVETGSDCVLSILAAEEVEYLFGLIGEGNSNLLNRTHDYDAAFTDAKHEQVAVSTPDNYTKLTSTAASAPSHGPGVTNDATGIAIADRNSVLLVVLVKDTGTEGRVTSLQYLDNQSPTSSISVHQTRASTSAIISETIRKEEPTRNGRSRQALTSSHAKRAMKGSKLSSRIGALTATRLGRPQCDPPHDHVERYKMS